MSFSPDTWYEVRRSKYCGGLTLFLTDGRIELNPNALERTIRPIALNRKDALFEGHDAGAQNCLICPFFQGHS